MIKTVQAEAEQREVTSTWGERYQGIHEWTLFYKVSMCQIYLPIISIPKDTKEKKKPLSKSLNKLK